MTDPTQTPSRTAAPADDEIDLGRLFGLLLDHKWLILSITFVFALVGVAYALLATPIYQSDALVQVERRSSVSPLGDLANVMGEVGGGGESSSTAAEVQILQSRMVLGQVVDRTGLETVVVPHSLPLIGEAIRRRGIERPGFMAGFPHVWGGERLELGRLEVTESLRGVPLIVTAGENGSYHVTLDSEKPRELGEGRVGELVSLAEGDIQLRIAELEAAPGAEFRVIKRTRPAAIGSTGQPPQRERSGRRA